MRRFLLSRIILLVALAFSLTASTFAQAPALAAGGVPLTPEQIRAKKMSDLFNGGLQYFEGLKYDEAIRRLEEYLGMLTESEKQGLASAQATFLVLGECYYRNGTVGGKLDKDLLQKAMETYWNEFIRRWPTDPRVLEVKVAIAQTYLMLKEWEKSISWWTQVETAAKAPEQRGLLEHSLSGQAYCYRQLKKPEDEIKTLEKLVYNPEFNTPVSAEGAVRLMTLYALKHDPADKASDEFANKAVDLLKKLQKKIHLVENLIALNTVAVKLGDDLLEVRAHAKALEAYWTVRPRDVVIKFQKDRIEAMEKLIDQNIKGAGKEPMLLMKAQRTNDEVVKPRLEEAKKLLAEFEKMADYMPAVYFRMARCHADMNKKWEAIVVFNQILQEYPTTPLREVAVFSRLALYADLGLTIRTYTLCDEYIKEFPTGPHVAQVTYIKAMAAMRKKEWFVAETNLLEAQKLLSDLPERTYQYAINSNDAKTREQAEKLKEDAVNHRKLYWPEVRYQLGNARFLQNKYDVAQKDFDSFIAEFGKEGGGKGLYMEDAEYQLALCHLFQGHYQKDPDKGGDEDGAIERLEAHVKKWGEKGNYGSDARYRLGVCHFAASEYDLAVQDCETWLKLFSENKIEKLQPEIYALLGDAKAGLKLPAEAAVAYIASYKHKNVSDEVLLYSLFEAGKQLQKAQDWEGIEKLYTELVKERPEHPATVTAIYWVGKAKAKLGRMEEAKELTVNTLKKHIANPKREGCEMMLSQLAEWSRRRPPSKEVVKSDAPQVKWDAEADLEATLKPLTEIESETAKWRLVYARGELFRIGRTPEKRVAVIGEIAEKAKVEDLSPHLLMEVGDYLLAKGEIDRAEAVYRRLKEDFPKSERVDAGWVGMGEVLLARKEYKKAMELYDYAIDRLGAPWKLKEALLGQAKCLLELADAQKGDAPTLAAAKYEKAKKTFEEVASVREWRGESTALALYYIADVLFRTGKFKEATAGFERITVTQGKFPKWVARSYLKAAEGYYRQGDDKSAIARLKDLLEPRDATGQPDEKKAEKFKDLPELDKARTRLAELGGV